MRFSPGGIAFNRIGRTQAGLTAKFSTAPMPTYTASSSDALSIHAVGVDAITAKILELYLTPRGHHITEIPSPMSYLSHRDAFHCDLLIVGQGTLGAQDQAMADVYTTTHQELPRAVVLAPYENPDAATLTTQGWSYVLRAPLGSDDVLRMIQVVLNQRRTVGTASASRAVPDAGKPVQGELAGLLALISETGIDETMVRELSDSFVTRGKEFIATLERGIAAGDYAAMDRICHTLKGMVGNMRFDELRTICEALERACRAHDSAAAQSSFATLRQQFDRVAGLLSSR